MPDTRRAATPAEITALVGYLDQQLTIPECARQSGLSQREVTELLGRHDITRRPGDTGTPQAATATAATDLPGHDDPPRPPQAANRTSRAGRHMTPQVPPARTAAPPAPQPAPAHQSPAASFALTHVNFLTIAEVALIMRVSKMTVYRLVHGGELESARVGRSFRIPEQAVTSYLRGAFITHDGQEP
jgi:excisionase family DNA binding protein